MALTALFSKHPALPYSLSFVGAVQSVVQH